MPDHFHVLLTVGSEPCVEQATQFIKGGFAFRAGGSLDLRLRFGRKDFSEVRILDGEAFARAAEYIRNNPVARCLVSRAEEFRFSSARTRTELDPMPQGLNLASFLILERHG